MLNRRTVLATGAIAAVPLTTSLSALAQSRIDAQSVQREALRLDLLAETARRYLAVAVARDQGDISRIDVEQRRRTVTAARHRHQAGASPESVVLTAEAALARAEMTVDRAVQQEQAARQHLAALWGERDPEFRIAAVDPLSIPDLADLSELTGWLERTPELARFAGEQRIGEARLQLARAAATPDLDWQLGVRRLQESDDTALVGSVSLPLGGTRRAQPQIRIAEAELAALGLQRESQGLSLYSTLVEAHGRYSVARGEVQRTAQDVLPRLASAERAAERAYRAGATSYLEWAQLQSERIAVQRQQLDAALEAQTALIEIQRLTGQPFVAALGADHPQKQEIEPELLAGSAVVADVLDQCATMGDLHHAIRAGLMHREDVRAELADVVSGKRAGRLSRDEIVVFDSTGTALQDVATAALVYQRARSSGAGLMIQLGGRMCHP